MLKLYKRFNIKAIKFFIIAFPLVFSYLSNSLQAKQTDPFKVLVFTKTNDYVHSSIGAGVSLIEELGTANNFEVTATDDDTFFTTETLQDYKVIVFCMEMHIHLSYIKIRA